ncbi:MAG: hypothetical protein JOZ51_26205 [Chloroflexi bacterium]|nr:hypothetical protein [Chloroflexota bacterium]
MPLLDYMRGQWATDVSNELNEISGTFPNVNRFYSPAGWFYEGTVQATAFAYLWDWLGRNEAHEYTLFSEQPYPRYPALQITDIMALRDNGNLIVVEVKADFNIVSVEDDLAKLTQAYHELPELVDAFAMYCVRADQAVRWRDQLRRLESEHVRALAIIKN